jgi:hypothetical protein
MRRAASAPSIGMTDPLVYVDWSEARNTTAAQPFGVRGLLREPDEQPGVRRRGGNHVHAHAVGGVLDRGLLAEVHQRALARAVRGMAGSDDETEGRPQRDHRPAPVDREERDRGPHAQERALHVDVEGVLPVHIGAVQDALEALDRGREHQRPQRPERGREAHGPVDRLGLRHVAVHTDGLTAGGGDRGRDPLRARRVEIGDHDRGAFLGEAVRDGLAQTSRAAGHEGNPGDGHR